MKPSKSYLKKSSIYFLFALILAFIARTTMGYFSDAVHAYTESMILNYAREVMDQGVVTGVIEELNGESLLQESYDSEGKVSYAYVDAQKLNKIRTNTSKYISSAIEMINSQENFEIIEIPLGYFFGRNYFLANGVRVPIDIEVVGSQTVEVKADVSSYGLNTTIIEINLIVSLEIRSVIPFQSQKIISKTIVPLSMEIMNNDIPYYLGSLLN